jgi:hypothetical protein
MIDVEETLFEYYYRSVAMQLLSELPMALPMKLCNVNGQAVRLERRTFSIDVRSFKAKTIATTATSIRSTTIAAVKKKQPRRNDRFLE